MAEKNKRDTVGKIYLDSIQKEPDTRNPIEIEQEAQKSYLTELFSRVEKDKEIYTGDFYIVRLLKREQLMPDMLPRGYMFTRHTCPTPQYDQTVFKYHAQDDEIEFLWTVPDLQTAVMLMNNKLYVHPQEYDLLKYVIDFFNGTLDTLAMKENGELLIT